MMMLDVCLWHFASVIAARYFGSDWGNSGLNADIAEVKRLTLSCLPGSYQACTSVQIFCTEKSIPKISNDAKIVCFSAVVVQRMSALGPIQIRTASWIGMVIEVVNRHVAQIANHQSCGNGGSNHESGGPPQRSEYNY